MAVSGIGDFVLAWYPAAFGRPEWEFATVAQSFAGLPLVALGLYGLLGSGMARGRRWLVMAASLLMGLMGLVVVLGLVLFLTDAPMALRASEGFAHTGIQKAIIKTAGLGVLFGTVFVFTAVTAVRGTMRGARG
jgi:hypothetical protein